MLEAEFKQQLELELSKFLKKEKDVSPTKEGQILLSRISSLVLRSGKRFRPLLLNATYQAYGGKNPESLINIGLALEFLHQALLIHDDIIDEDLIRYDGPNVAGYYTQDKHQPPNIPASMALLAGHLLLSLASKAILKDKDLSLNQKSKVLALISQATIGEVYGQQLDILNDLVSPSDLTDQRLIQTHQLKTACYTTELPMQIAAAILDLPSSENKKIYTFANNLGIYFQLVDDYCDYFVGNSAFDSRPKFRDYPSGKATHPYIRALKLASPADQKFLKHHFGDKDVTQQIRIKVVAILTSCGADKESKKFADKYYTDLSSDLAKLNISASGKKTLAQLIQSIKIS
jgi:geranylgeranyl diphosphate synthase, type II